MPTIGVFCGSAMPHDKLLVRRVQMISNAMAKNGWNLVYGGGDKGLMGVVARAFLKQKRSITGVMPYALYTDGKTKRGLPDTTTVIVEDMFRRKQVMMERSHGFIILPGGLGTLDELTEVLSHRIFGTYCPSLPYASRKPITMPLCCKGDKLTYQLLRQRQSEGFFSNLDYLHVGKPEESLRYLQDAFAQRASA